MPAYGRDKVALVRLRLTDEAETVGHVMDDLDLDHASSTGARASRWWPMPCLATRVARCSTPRCANAWTHWQAVSRR